MGCIRLISVLCVQMLLIGFASSFVVINSFLATSRPNLGSSVQLSCTVQGLNSSDVSMTVSGNHGNASLIDTVFQADNKSVTKLFETKATYVLSQYECSVTVGSEKVQKNITLEPYVQPSLVNPARITNVWSTSVEVRWDEWSNTTDVGDGPVILYIIKYREPGTTLLFSRHVGTTPNFVLTGLRPRTSYELFVLCQRPGPGGVGPMGPPVNFSTTCPDLNVEDINFTNIRTNPLNVMVTWSPSKSPFCQTLYYEVSYRLLEQDGCLSFSNDERITVSNTTDVQIKAKHLHFFSTYKFSVRAFSETGPGPFAEAIHQTPEGVPKRPQNVSLQRAGSDFLRFQWERLPCGSRSTTIRRYQFELYDSKGVLIQRGRILNKKMSSKLTGLEPCTPYRFRVAAVGSERFGTYSELVEGTTLTGVPSTVSDVNTEVTKVGPIFELSVSWNPPASFLCPITGYSVEIFLLNSDHCLNLTGRLIHSEYNITRSNISVSNLQPFSYYKALISASSIAGQGEAAEVTIVTPQTVPMSAPLLHKRPLINHNSVTFFWLPVPCGSRGGTVGDYFYKLLSNNEAEVVTGTLRASTDELTLFHLESCKSYLFQIRARNEAGLGPFSEPEEITTEAMVPRPVRDVSVEYQPGDTTQVLVRWNTPGYTPCPVTSYSVQISLAQKDMCSQRQTDVGRVVYNTDQLSHQFRDLYSNSLYEIGIAAITEAGRGELRTLMVQTKSAPPSQPPQSVGLQSQGATRLTFSWELPPCGSRKGKIIKYMYQLLTADGKTVREEHTTDYFAELVHLKPYTYYLFRVRAHNKVGHGPFTEDFEVQTKQSTPEEPYNLTVLNRTDVSIAISWGTPLNPNGLITNYTIYYGPTENMEDGLYFRAITNMDNEDYYVTDDEVDDIDDNSDGEDMDEKEDVYITVFDRLKPATEYVFIVQAHTITGPGEGAQITDYTRVTAPDAPSAPILLSQRNGDDPVVIQFQKDAPFIDVDVLQVVVTHRKNVVSRSLNEIGNFGTSPDKYVAAEWPPEELPDKFVVGDKRRYGSYYNAPLREDSTYDVALCSVCRSSKDSATTCSTPLTLSAKHDLTSEAVTVYPELAFIAGLCFLVILAVLLAMLLVKRRLASMPPMNESFTKELSESMDSAIDVTTPPPEPMKRRGGAIRHKPKVAPRRFLKHNSKLSAKTAIADLPYHVRQLRANGDEKFKNNFMALPGDQLYSTEAASRTENRRKNRYLNTHPYDHSRVILQELPDVPFSDYINASYIDGFAKERQYIATQGPSNSTLGDFWRMVWQENVSVIVMLTNLKENEKKKCEQYWPARNHFYGSISVFLIDEQNFTDFTERTLLLKKDIYTQNKAFIEDIKSIPMLGLVSRGMELRNISTVEGKDGEGETRQLHHCHFTSWPDMTLPESPTSLLLFRHQARSHVTNSEHPILVHCSAGVGRTGTFIAIDAMIEMAEQENALDIWEFLWNMRTKRTRMVQTLEQFMFIYECLLEELNCGPVDCATISIDRELLNLRDRNPVTGRSYLEEQLLVLDALAVDPSNKDVSAGTSEENLEKNRFEDIVPIDRLRPYLMTGCNDGCSNYVNAIFVPGYKCSSMFLLTQTPLENTVSEFWKMVWDYKAAIIVCVDDLTDEDWSVAKYWHEEEDVYVEPFEIRTTTSEVAGGICRREISIRNTNDEDDDECPPKIIQQLEMVDWPIDKVMPSRESFLSLVEMVESFYRHTKGGPIVVHCRTGIYRCGLFCAVYTAIAKLKSELKVDVFHVVKNLRKCNRRIVSDEVYIESSHTYPYFVLKSNVMMESKRQDYSDMVVRSRT